MSLDDENIVREFIISLLSEDGDENISDNDRGEYDTDPSGPELLSSAYIRK